MLEVPVNQKKPKNVFVFMFFPTAYVEQQMLPMGM